MAKRRTAKQRAATRKMIAANRRKRRGGKRRRRRAAPRRRRALRRRRMRANPVAKTAAGRRRQRAASRRNIKKAQRARRRTRRVSRRVGAIRKAAGRGGIRLVRVRRASTPIVIEEKPRRRRKKALLENPRRRRKTRRRSRRRSRRYAANTMLQQNAGMRFADRGALLDNPYDGMLQENQTFSVSAVRAFGMAGLGVGVGLFMADMADRFVATRKPTGGNRPYFGSSAAAAQNRRPDAWRLGAQAAGGVAGVALAYAVRGRSVLPFLVGGTAVGFFANLTKMLLTWYAAPMALKVKSGNEETVANRLYPLEQKSIQDVVDQLFQNWQATNALNSNQQGTIIAIQPVPGSGPAYTLGRRGNGAPAVNGGGNGVPQGKARAQSAEANGRVGQPSIVPTGRLGMCPSCGGEGGCWDHCPDLTICGDCPDELVARRCEYCLEAGDDIPKMAALHGIDMRQVTELNPQGFGTVGSRVVLPYAFCKALENSHLSGVPEAQESPTPSPVAVHRSGSALPFGMAAAPDE